MAKQVRATTIRAPRAAPAPVEDATIPALSAAETHEVVKAHAIPRPSDSHAADFARRLHKAMRDRDMSQSALAAAVWGTRDAMIGGQSYTVSRNRDRVSMYLAGRAMPRPDALEKIANALGVKPSELAPGAQSPSDRVPPEVSFTMLDGTEALASLRVNAVIPASVALEISRLIADAKAKAKKDAGAP